MKNGQNGKNGHEPEIEEIELEVDDVDDLKQRRRLEQVLEAEKQVHEMRMKASVASNQNDGLLAYRTVLENYILMLGPIMRDERPPLWDEKPQFSLTLEAPSARDFMAEQRQGPNPPPLDNQGRPRFGRLAGLDRVTPKAVSFEGLGDLVAAPNVLEASWTVTYYPRGGGQKSITKQQKQPLPQQILDRAFMVAQDFAADQGLSLNRSDGERPMNTY